MRLLAGLILAVVARASVYEQALSRYNHTDYKGAVSLLRQSPEDARSLELLGRCYLMDAEYKAATGILEKAAALEPNNSMTLTWLARAYGHRAETSSPITALPFALKSRETFERAVQLDAHNSEAVNDLFEFYIQAPGVIGGGVDKARGLIPLIAKNDPAEAYFAEARIAQKKQDYSSAEAQLRKAVQLAPHSVGRLIDLARILSKQGRYEESDKTFAQAEAVAPAAPKILYARAECYIQSKRNVEQARDLLKRYLAQDLTPDDPTRASATRLLKQSEGL